METEFGLASGVVNTAFMMGGALALAALASVAAARSDSLRSSERRARRLNGGYNAAFVIGAVFAVAAAVVGDPHPRRAAQRGRGGAGRRDGGH